MSTAANSNQVERKHFSISREMDFFAESELVKQTGHAVEDWPLVIVKELIDNALDACEEANIPPFIEVYVLAGQGIFIRDNGPGIPREVVSSMLDFRQRVSSRSAYVAPDRGRQGNALKTIVAMPFVLSQNSSGRTYILTQKIWHDIAISLDPIRQRPEVLHDTKETSDSEGTGVFVQLPTTIVESVKTDIFGSSLPGSHLFSKKSRFLPLFRTYAMLNPHMNLLVKFDGNKVFAIEQARKCEKWKPSDPTDPAWYDEEDLRKLIAAHISKDSGTDSVREFLAQFRGLTSTTKRKRIMQFAGLEPRMKLSEMLKKSEMVNKLRIRTLLFAMKEEASPLKPKMLGPVGEDHLRRQFASLRCSEESFVYKQISGEVDGMPWIVETAFGYCPGRSRQILTGVNWSPAIRNPFREIDDGSLDELLADLWVCDESPVVFFLHLICPKVKYTDHGKTNIVVGPMDPEVVVNAIKFVTKRWTKQRKSEERHESAKLRREATMNRTGRRSLISAAFTVMEQAYMQASNNGTLPANARQIMYAARPSIQDLTGGSLNDKYFTQHILPRYIAENPDQTADWDVVFDARGHFVEPHTFNSIGLGTLDVRQYLLRNVPIDSFVKTRCPLWPTTGSQNRFSAILFVEKEGFNPLFERARIAEKYDIAIMSTKGMSVIASRLLIDAVCGKYDIPLLVMHDFDKSGFSILGTLSRTSDRYTYRHRIRAIDLGLRLSDVEEMGLRSESVAIKGGDDARENLLRNGATEREIDFLIQGQRVELNAMSASQLLSLLERKLVENGIQKVVPTEATLAEAYRRVVKHEIVQDQLVEIHKAASDRALETIVPDGISEKVAALLNDNPLLPWDRAVEQVARHRER